jgi:serine/threonine-protein kinase
VRASERIETATLAGRMLAGKYLLRDLLGRGGMGSVWRAEHLTLKSHVAVKVVEAHLGEDRRARFLREAQAAASLRSPHVVQILDHGVDGELLFIVMELLDGETLGARIRRLGRLPADETIRILTHVARALTRAHEARIVHRDLKPDNIFLVKNDDEEMAKVLDFGVAKREAAQPGTLETRSGVMLGTPAYMSPEQAWGTRTVDWRSDLWSLGVIAFECLTGRRPFEGGALGELVIQVCTSPHPPPSSIQEVPTGFDEWVARALSKEPEGRFQSAREMIDALRQVLGGAPLPQPSRPDPVVTAAVAPTIDIPRTTAGVVARTHSTPPTRKVWIAIPAVLVALALASVVVIQVMGRKDRQPATQPVAEPAPPPVVATSAPAATTVTPPPPPPVTASATASAAPKVKPRITAPAPKPTTTAAPKPTIDLGL